ncbi:hypothetical protein FOZ63_005656, partial [Perkinsus olseni]
HCCRASSSPTTPSIERIVEDGQHRLLARLMPVENALIYPYRASKRRRPPVDDTTIREKLTQMCRLGMAAKSADKDVIVVWNIRAYRRGRARIPLPPHDRLETLERFQAAMRQLPQATVIHVKDDVLISSSDIETGHKAWVIVSDILHRKGGFIVNGSKSQPPPRTASFCGLQLEGMTYEPTPSRREFTEATYNFDSGSSAEDIDSTVPIVSSAFRVLTDFYLSGVIPCAIGNDGIATLV